MKRFIIGIIIGIILVLLVKTTYADQNRWRFKVNNNDTEVVRIQDGGINCYISQSAYSGYGATGGISCLKK